MRTDRHPVARPLPVALVALAALGVLAGACTGAQRVTPVATGAPEPTPIGAPTVDPSSPQAPVTPVPGGVEDVPRGILDAVLADAAARTGVAVADITVVEAKAVTWPNGALGCPKPGFMYTDMIVEGYLVVVEAGGRQLDYRGGSGGTPTLCENPPPSG